jgi:hypothetical protein
MFLVDSEINSGFTSIDTITTATIINDRLVLAGASATISESSDISILENAALSMTLWEKTKIITESYADPEMASKYRFLKGEVYEFAGYYY